MNYGIDIDDTISKTADKFIEYGREFNKQVLKRGYNDKLSEIPDHFYLKYIFGWNQDEQRKFLEEYGYYKKMIENAGLGIAMKHSTPVVTEICDYITDSNNDEGVAKALEKFC